MPIVDGGETKETKKGNHHLPPPTLPPSKEKAISIEATVLGVTGGRLSRACQKALSKVEEEAKKIGANAVIGANIDYETPVEGMTLMVTVNGTAVVIE